MEETIKHHTCTKCGKEKPLTSEYFYKNKSSKSGFRNECKVCFSNERKIYYEKNKEELILKSKIRVENLVKENPNYHKDLYYKNYENLKKNRIERYKNRSEEEKEKKLRYNQQYVSKNHDKIRDYNSEYQIGWRKKNIDKVREYRKKYNNEYYKIEINRVIQSTRDGIRASFSRHRWKKTSRTQEYIGCNWETFKEHIESQFTEGMSWDNKSEWHYDHYYPLSLAQTHEDMFIFNHYTNFQPLWVKDNLSKSDKVPDGFEGWYDMMTKRLDTHSKV